MATNDDPDIGGTGQALAREKDDEELGRFSRRKQLKALNLDPSAQGEYDPCVYLLIVLSVLN